MLTFNLSVSNREVFNNLEFPVQIMPQQQKMLTLPFIRSFPSMKEWSESVIHTSYIVKIWNPEINDPASKVYLNMKFYLELALKIKFKRILVHLPNTEKEWSNLDVGMKRMIELFNKFYEKSDKNIKIVFEIPAFVSNFKMNIHEYIDKVLTYQKQFSNSFEIVFDTAHLYSNGLEADEMLELIKKYKDHSKIIHLNGNLRDKYTSDKHIQIFSEKSKIKNIDSLMNYFSESDLILIAENTSIHENYDSWKEFSNKYKLKIIPFIKELSL